VVALARNAESLVEDDNEELAEDDEQGVPAEAGDLDQVEPGDIADETGGVGE
jgi:hypothetical protein